LAGLAVCREIANREQLIVYKATETKTYDFVTGSAEHASEIVEELKKGISPYREV